MLAGIADVLTLLDRPDRRIADIPLEHVGFTVPTAFSPATAWAATRADGAP